MSTLLNFCHLSELDGEFGELSCFSELGLDDDVLGLDESGLDLVSFFPFVPRPWESCVVGV